MISLKPKIVWSNVVTHPVQSGSGNTVITINHNQGREPDRVMLYAFNDGIWKPVYTVWLESPNYRGWYIAGYGNNANTTLIVVHGLHVYDGGSSVNVKVKLEWD
jgi:hypothetical protein